MDNRPTHWCLGWDGRLNLGFDDGNYLMRKHGLMFYPEYFDENGKPKLDMLPIDSMELAEERRKKRKKAEREKKWWYKLMNWIRRKVGESNG